MNRYIFAAGNNIDVDIFMNIEIFTNYYPEFHDVSLENEIEFNQLLKYIGLNAPEPVDLTDSEDFSIMYNISGQKIKVFTEEEFGEFYQKWLKLTNRENTMDEYGQLLFVLGHGESWNSEKHIFILLEKT